jgi:hypothetical protein
MVGAKRRVFYMGLLQESYHIPFAGRFPTHSDEHKAQTLTSIAKTSIPQWNKVIQQSCTYHQMFKL